MVTPLDELAEAFAVDLAVPTRAALLSYAGLVAKWNAQLDLTAARDGDPFAEVLFADALVLSRPDLVPKKSRVIDVGAGAGAPALPLAILRPDLDVTMIEPLRKRVAFLRTAIGTLDLADRVRVIEARLEPEDASAEPRGFDVALSRATFAPDLWLPLGLRLGRRALVLTAGSDPPHSDAAREVASAEYVIPSTSAPRRITAYEQSG